MDANIGYSLVGCMYPSDPCVQPKKLEFVKEDSCKRKITALTSKLVFLPPPPSQIILLDQSSSNWCVDPRLQNSESAPWLILLRQLRIQNAWVPDVALFSIAATRNTWESCCAGCFYISLDVSGFMFVWGGKKRGNAFAQSWLFWSLKYRCFLGIQIKKCRLAAYLMEHIYFEAQSCSETATLKEKSKNAKEQNTYVWRIENM